MIHAFVFIGEFGYELFNWQGVVRKWAIENKKPNDKIFIFSRNGLQSLYEYADEYINISTLESYNKTVADCYSGYVWEESELPFDDWPIIRRGKHLEDIKRDVVNLIDTSDDIDWVFSCDYRQKDGYHFGLGGPGGGSIYDGRLNLENNKYVKIKPVADNKQIIQSKVSIDLDKPYILCQTGFRDGKGYTSKSKVKIDHQLVFDNIELNLPILFLDFNSGRYWDRNSNFSNAFDTYKCSTFDEQSTLILNCEYCIFTTEGDFRSHLYLPPMLGKDVHIIASNEVLRLPSASVDFWNKNIFHYGGHMHTYEYEEFTRANNIRYEIG